MNTPPSPGIVRQTLHWLRWLLLTLILLVLSLAALGQWWLLPQMNHYRDDLSTVLQNYLQMPVHIQSMTATRDSEWLGLRLQKVHLDEPEHDVTWASFSQVAITLDLWRSLREWRLAFGSIRLEGVKLVLEQNENGGLRLLAGRETTAPNPSKLLRWLFSLHQLEVIGEQWSLRQHDGVTLELLQPYLHLQSTAHAQQLSFSADLPADQGEHIQLTAERQSIDAADPERGQGTFKLHTERLQMTHLPLPIPFNGGQADLEVSGQWQNWQPLQLEGGLRLREVSLRSTPRFKPLQNWLAQYPGSELTLDWQRNDAGWQLQAQSRFSDKKGQVVEQPTLTLNQVDGQRLGMIREIQLEGLLTWISPWLDEPAYQWLTELKPQGELPEITIKRDIDSSHYALGVKLEGLSIQSARGFPGFQNISGHLDWTPVQGQLELDCKKLRVDTDGLLRKPITFNTLKGAVKWQYSTEGWRVESDSLDLANPDLAGRFWGSVTLPTEGKPLLDLHGKYHDVKVSRAKHYLPVKVIPPKGVAWLDRALVAGQVTSGTLVLRGHPQDFPFDKEQGLFETRFHVKDSVLDYMEDLPRLEQLQATVLFRNSGLSVEAESGRILDTVVEKTTVEIPDLSNMLVKINGQVHGSGASMWKALNESQFRKHLGKNLPQLDISGTNTLKLDLAIPIGDKHPKDSAQVQGQVAFLKGGVTFPDWDIAFDQLQGEIDFGDKGLHAQNLQALLRGSPIRLDLETSKRKKNNELQIRLRGDVGWRELLGKSAANLNRYVSGKSHWDAKLRMPIGVQDNHAQTAELDLQSDLKGVALKLLPPFAKSADQLRSMKVAVRPHQHGHLQIALQYGEDVSAIFLMRDFATEPQLERGEFRVGAGMAKLPKTKGLNVIARLPDWEWSAPESSSEPVAPDCGKPRQQTPHPLALLHRLDVQFEQLKVAGQTFTGMKLDATRHQDGLHIHVENEDITGRVTVPDQPTMRRPINAALQRLNYRSAPNPSPETVQKTTSASSPCQIPPFVLTISDLRLNDRHIGGLRVIAEPRPDGLHLPKIDFNAKHYQIDANGDWWWHEGSQHSKIQATLYSASLGAALTGLGYPPGLKDGETKAEMALEYPAALPDFSLKNLSGTLQFQMGEGRLLEVDPGMGRIIGLFSMRSLARRLTLDFSDLFQEGLSFDQISGKFVFKQGLANTNDLTIQSPAARILITGQTDLRQRRYDQKITVTPQMDGALPVAGMLAGGPAVGAAMFVAERILQGNIKDATSYRYVLKGSWDDPVLEPMDKPPSTSRHRVIGDK